MNHPCSFRLVVFLLAALLKAGAQNNATPLDSALIACYPFSGNANDNSGNGNNGTVNGAVLTTDRNGNANAAYSFNGVNQNISIPGFSSQVPANNFSISFWATATNNPTRSAFLMSPDDVSNRLNIHIYYTTQTFWDFGDIFSNGRLYVANGALPSPNTWDHWVFVVGSANGGLMKIYKNGVLFGSQGGSSTYSSAQLKNLLIGGGVGTGSSYLWFEGKLDDIKIYKRLLLPNDVISLYTSSFNCTQCVGTVSAPVNTTPAGNLNICTGQSAQLSVSATGTVNWYNSANPSVMIATGSSCTTQALSTGTYTYLAFASSSCQSSGGTPVIVTVNDLSMLSVSGSTTVCSGQPVILNTNYNTPGSVSWYNSVSLTAPVGVGNSYSVPALPAGSYSYYAVLNASCPPASPAVAVINFNPLPVISLLTKSHFICAGQPAVITASGAVQYNWSTGASTSSISVNPSATTAYSVTGTALNGCVNTASVSMIVSDCTGIESYAAGSSQLDVYPNPSNGEFTLRLTAFSENTQVKIYNAAGELVGEVKPNKDKSLYHFENYAKGIYHIHVSENSQSLGQWKLIVK